MDEVKTDEFDVTAMTDEELRQIIVDAKEEAYGRGLSGKIAREKRKRDGTAKSGGGGVRKKEIV